MLDDLLFIFMSLLVHNSLSVSAILRQTASCNDTATKQSSVAGRNKVVREVSVPLPYDLLDLRRCHNAEERTCPPHRFKVSPPAM